ncbi:MAG: carboxylating nicotinate-nucleotide diphosphorylase [Ignavibacteriaceae bacterium]|nr:carboxylating nicotinate-nucleotide diphosphorylase [Ignavibacteriaceae bacterium]
MINKIIIDPSIEDAIKRALDEDIRNGDITTTAIFNEGIYADGYFLVKENGIIAGLEVVQKVLELVDDSIKFESDFVNGQNVKSGTIVANISGKASSLLTAERTALNFFQRMSGIATLTNQYVELIKHTKAKLLDTRKTMPGLRMLDKLSVMYGGGKNHRIGLFDMFLIKDNHISVAGSITSAVKKCIEYKINNKLATKIEVEVSSINQIEEAISSGADIIMLDNFDLDSLNKAVNIIANRCITEASGGVNLSTIKSIAETGVDFISVGAITHSVKALDISLELNLKQN